MGKCRNFFRKLLKKVVQKFGPPFLKSRIRYTEADLKESIRFDSQTIIFQHNPVTTRPSHLRWAIFGPSKWPVKQVLPRFSATLSQDGLSIAHLHMCHFWSAWYLQMRKPGNNYLQPKGKLYELKINCFQEVNFMFLINLFRTL